MDSRLVRWLGWLGVLATVLILVDFFALGLNEPDFGTSGTKIIAFYQHHQGREIASQYVTVLLLIVVMVFCGALRRALILTTAQRVLPSVAFGGGVVFLAGSATTGFAELALIDGSNNHLSPAAAEALSALTNAIPIGFIVGAFIILGATAVTLLSRDRALAPGNKLTVWGWVSLVLCLAVAAFPVVPFALLLFPIWLIVTGFMLHSAPFEPRKVRSEMRSPSMA